MFFQNLLGAKCEDANKDPGEIVAVLAPSDLGSGTIRVWVRLTSGPDRGRVKEVDLDSLLFALSGYAVFLLDPGERKIECIKVIRRITEASLKDAKDISEKCPTFITPAASPERAFTKEQAYQALGLFIQSGSNAEISEFEGSVDPNLRIAGSIN